MEIQNLKQPKQFWRRFEVFTQFQDLLWSYSNQNSELLTNTSGVKNREYRNRPTKYRFKTKLPKQYNEEEETFLTNDTAAAACLFGKELTLNPVSYYA